MWYHSQLLSNFVYAVWSCENQITVFLKYDINNSIYSVFEYKPERVMYSLASNSTSSKLVIGGESLDSQTSK